MRTALLLLSLIILAGCARAPLRRQEVSLWYWHSPFAVTPDEREEMRRMGVERLFVRAATFSFDGERFVPKMPQRWEEGAEGMRAHLVFRFDQGAVGHFAETPNDVLAEAIAKAYDGQKARAEGKGLRVEGCQLDLDCPTRLLPKYAELLREIRERVGKGTQLSFTALPTWLSSRDLRDTARAADFFVPQFYEGRVPRTVDDLTPLADLPALRRDLATLESLGVPYYIGVPAYGRAILYDDRGQMAGIYGGLGAQEAVRHPSFVVESTAMGLEERVRLRAVRPGRDGKGVGYRLVYRLPTPVLVAEYLRAVRSARPAHCLGSLIFRYPEEGESMALPLPTLRAAVRGETPSPDVRVSVRSKSAPFSIIESPEAGGFAREVLLRVENRGDGGSLIAENALTLVLRFEPGTLEEAQPGGFDSATPILGDASTAGKVSAARADGLLVRRARLAPGESATFGPVRLRGKWIEGSWRLRGQDGRIFEGRIERTRFQRGD